MVLKIISGNNQYFVMKSIQNKNNFFKPVVVLVLIVCCAVLAAGCVESDPIVGSWSMQISGASSVLQFNSDGTGTITSAIDGFDSSVVTPMKWQNKDGKYLVGIDGAELQSVNIIITDSDKGKIKMSFDGIDYVKTN